MVTLVAGFDSDCLLRGMGLGDALGVPLVPLISLTDCEGGGSVSV